jgi:hypothetical protein
VARQQDRAEPLFQLFDLDAKRRLRDIAAARPSGNAPSLNGGDKIFYLS